MRADCRGRRAADSAGHELRWTSRHPVEVTAMASVVTSAARPWTSWVRCDHQASGTTPVPRVCDRSANPVQDQVLRDHPWNFFAVKRAVLASVKQPAWGLFPSQFPLLPTASGDQGP